MEEGSVGDQEKLNLWQRTGLRKLRKDAGRKRGEPLKPEDWQAYYNMEGTRMMRAIRWVWRALPSSPRCGRCGAPFAGFGRYIVKPLGYTPSRKNPTVCASCVETSPPGGVTMRAGVLFADIRGFTAKSAQLDDPVEVSRLLTRFYGCAEDVFFPEAVIDKLIGDEVMALYLPDVLRNVDQDEVPALMLAHGRRLLELVGYGSAEGPFAETGIGMDFGDAFVGNIGERALYDFTAVGDVVNTASRLQAQAAGGEIVFSERVAQGLPEQVGSREELDLKGKSEPQVAYRVAA
jgi:adenylate cyclase